MDNFREWLSDNLRYILLGLAGILILVIAFFAIRLVTSLSSHEDEPETTVSTEAATEAGTETGTDSGTSADNRLVQNDPAILNLMTRYYTARVEKDYDTLASLCEVFDEAAQAEIEAQDAAFESYSNIRTYSEPGLTDGTYIVYTYFDMKLTGITTTAPSLRGVYVVTDPEDNLIIGDPTGDTEVSSYILQRRADDDVQELMNDVQNMLDAAMETDAELKAYVESHSESADTGTTAGGESGTADGDSTDAGDGSADTAVIGAMQTNTTVNVRETTSADSTLYGVLESGTQVEVLDNLDNGWSQIRYTVNGTTIEGYVMTQYLSSVG